MLLRPTTFRLCVFQLGALTVCGSRRSRKSFPHTLTPHPPDLPTLLPPLPVPQANVSYSRRMPEIEDLMQEWPAEMESFLKTMRMPSGEMVRTPSPPLRAEGPRPREGMSMI